MILGSILAPLDCCRKCFVNYATRVPFLWLWRLS